MPITQNIWGAKGRCLKIAILPEGKDAAENFQTFKNELQEIGLTAENVTGLSLEGKSNGKKRDKIVASTSGCHSDDTLVYSILHIKADVCHGTSVP